MTTTIISQLLIATYYSTSIITYIALFDVHHLSPPTPKAESPLHRSFPQSFSFSPFQFPHGKTKKARNKWELTIEEVLVTRSGGEERNRKGKSPEVAAVSPWGIAGGRHGLWGGWAARPEASSALATAGSQARTRTGSWGSG